MSSSTRIQLQPAYLLHRRPYRDTSLLVELCTLDHGRVSVVARGARTRAGGGLRAFCPLLVSWSGRGDLHTLTAVEAAGPGHWLTGAPLISGLYLNELLLRLLPRHDAHGQVYHAYGHALAALAEHAATGAGGIGTVREWALRIFEKRLLQELGYGLCLTQEAETGCAIERDRRYEYHSEAGPVPVGSGACSAGIQGRTLLALDCERWEEGVSLKEAKHLMRQALAIHLEGRPLHSRGLFAAWTAVESG